MKSSLGACILCLAFLLAQPVLARAQMSPAADEVQARFRGRAPLPPASLEDDEASPSDHSDRVMYSLIGGGVGLGVGLGIFAALWLSTEPDEPTASQVELHGEGGEGGLGEGYAKAFVLIVSIPLVLGCTGLGALVGGSAATASPAKVATPVRDPRIAPVAILLPDRAYIGARVTF